VLSFQFQLSAPNVFGVVSFAGRLSVSCRAEALREGGSVLQLFSFDEQSHRKKELSDASLSDIKPSRPPIQNQAADEQQIQKHNWRGEKNLTSQPVLRTEMT